MSFIITDLDSSEVFDIVENRQLPFLIKYFSKFSKNARRSVKTIVIDMYKPYITLIKKLLPNTKIIFDRFHIVNNLSRAFNKTRIEVMKKLPTSSMDYKRLKRYWKLFQKKFSELDADNYNRFVHFKDLISEAGVVHRSMEIDKSLEDTYEIYQILLNDINSKNADNLKIHLENFKDKGSTYMQTAIKTLLKDFDYVKNAIAYRYSNGFTEGINNFIKALKRVAFGYKSFFHFRSRILITRKLKKMLRN